MYDIEMMQEVGYCSGIENYARHLAGLQPGARPYTLIDYFPEDFLLFIDESHATIPQVKAMWAGDRHRKETLIEHGFRLPSALDNRPLRFEEFEESWARVIFVSATPAPFELELCDHEVVEQVIRPTGLLDPEIFVYPAGNQIPHLLGEIEKRVEAKERVLVTTLTKRMAEDLSGYITKKGFKCRYLHSEIDTLERIEILRDLRKGNFNVNASVFLYADKVTPSMQKAIDETERRRKIQLQYNKEHNITPETIRKEIRASLTEQIKARQTYERVELATQIEKEMLEAAQSLDFERAAFLRDQLRELKELPELVLVDSRKKKSDFLAMKKQKRYNKKSTLPGNPK